jgi:uncharacterized protein (DUF2336 family)
VVTDILIRRGELPVHRRLAASSDARFSEDGMSRLVKQAETDDTLTETLGLRIDLPVHLLRRLLSKAGALVREKLLRLAPQHHRDELTKVLSGNDREVVGEAPPASDFDLARQVILGLSADGELDEIALLQFVKGARYAEAIMALSQMCATPHDIIDRIVQSNRREALIIPCRAIGLSWTTVRSLIQYVSQGLATPEELEALKLDYAKLQPLTAQRVLRFWCMQSAAGKDSFAT